MGKPPGAWRSGRTRKTQTQVGLIVPIKRVQDQNQFLPASSAEVASTLFDAVHAEIANQSGKVKSIRLIECGRAGYADVRPADSR